MSAASGQADGGVFSAQQTRGLGEVASMYAETALAMDYNRDGLSGARGLGLAICFSAVIWGALALIKVALW